MRHHTSAANVRSPYATAYTRTGKVNMINGKPFRTAAQKQEAQRLARKCDDGTFRSTAPVSFHRKSNQQKEG